MTYALGVSDTWISQFETIALQAPTWYSTKDTFNMHDFGRFITTTMLSSPFSSSSGGRGGGCAGGGFGGGSISSW